MLRGGVELVEWNGRNSKEKDRTCEISSYKQRRHVHVGKLRQLCAHTEKYVLPAEQDTYLVSLNGSDSNRETERKKQKDQHFQL